MRKHGKRYTKEQKAEAVRLVKESGQAVREVAEHLDISNTALHRWVKKAKVDSGEVRNGSMTTEEQKEVRKLRREVQTLRMENEFLKKVSAFFARENETSSR